MIPVASGSRDFFYISSALSLAAGQFSAALAYVKLYYSI
jgi:hypothetical protein